MTSIGFHFDTTMAKLYMSSLSASRFVLCDMTMSKLAIEYKQTGTQASTSHVMFCLQVAMALSLYSFVVDNVQVHAPPNCCTKYHCIIISLIKVSTCNLIHLFYLLVCACVFSL